MNALPTPDADNTLEQGLRYLALGWKLCLLRPNSKIPCLLEWNSPHRVIGDENPLRQALADKKGYGLGLVHEYSNTGALDIDHLAWCQMAFGDELGIDLMEMLAGYPRIRGRDGRDKYLFQLPADFIGATHKLTWPTEDADPDSPNPMLRQKKAVLMELRCKGGQDVLPPTIHPDTGQPYTWLTPPWDGIPEIPAPLLAIWKCWDDFKPQLESACPWAKVKHKPPEPPAAKRLVGQHGDSLIAQFNAAFSLTDLLEANGYRRKGKRWLSPNSSTGIPGVVVLPESGRCFSHHASCPLNDTHAHDAFDVFMLLEHDGEIKAALNAARIRLGLPAHVLPEVDMTALLLKAKQGGQAPPGGYRAQESGEPSAVFDQPIPGVLGEFEEWAFASSLSATPSRHVARMAALGFGSVVLGRKYKTSRSNYSSLLFLQLDESGGGKEDLKTAIDRAMRQCNLSASRMGGSWYTSEIAVISALHEKPVHITIVDEFGLKIAAARNKGNNTPSASALSAVMEAATKCHTSISSTAASTRGLNASDAARMRLTIVNPALTVVAMSTRTSMIDALTTDDITSGFLNRWVVMVNPDRTERPDYSGFFDTPTAPPVPDSVAQWVNQHCPIPAPGLSEHDNPALEVEANVIPFTPAAQALVIQYLDDIEQLKLGVFASAPVMTKRMNEHAMRLSLIVALSDGQTAIDAQHFAWARDFITYHQRAAFRAFASQLTATDFGRLRQRILDFIRTRNGGKEVARRDLGRFCRAWIEAPKHLRDSAVAVLVEDGLIALSEHKTMAGRSSIYYTAINDDDPDDSP